MKGPQPGSNFIVAGRVQLEKAEDAPRDLELKAYVFDPAGRFLGSGDVDAQGNFETEVRLAQPLPVEITVAPPGDPETIRRSSLQRQRFSEKEWAAEGRRFRLSPNLHLRPDDWQLFLPLWICVSGHVRKVFTRSGNTEVCPVPFVKVEVFDVDREECWWPYIIRRLDQVLDLKVLRASDLLKTAGGSPRAAKASHMAARSGVEELAPAAPDVSQTRVGEAKSLAAGVASRLENLTLTSIIAPWVYFPRCFYSRALVCETFTDCDGFFSCCFPWRIFHFRRGRLRVDVRPDIIIRVTQIVNGVETVIYMDPYTSTRWNITNTHVDLFLDDEAIVCGGCASDPLPGTSRASILQIGSDPVWLVDQADGKFKTPPYSNGAFGGSMYLRGNFTADLLTGSPRRYYKLSYAPVGSSDFKPVLTPLSTLRSAPGGSFETYLLGPQPDGSPVAGLYEVQDTAHWWLMPGVPGGPGMILGDWATTHFEDDQGTYILRMEVFDEAGNKITTMQFDNHGGNGTGADPDPVPTVTDHLDLKFYIDNKPVEFDLTTPATNECGVVPWSPLLSLVVHVRAEQENGRVHSWDLRYVKGVDPTRIFLDEEEYNSGQGSVGLEGHVNANALLAGLDSTCAFALILRAWAHVRDNWGFTDYGEKIYAIAIERCSSP